ncbi:MAG: GNAT family N-acetyltransferase [Candidatus Binataceae bacterium]
MHQAHVANGAPAKEVIMSLNLRPGTKEDAITCGTICYEAFKSIGDAHNFPPDFPTPEAAIGVVTALLCTKGAYSVVAEEGGKILGSNFMDERNSIAGIGPITVDPAAQNRDVGKTMMLDALQRARQRQFAGVRLVQTAYHNRSLALYTKLGFDSREELSIMQGPRLNLTIPGCSVRKASEADLAACNALCTRVHGHHRGGELIDVIRGGSATVVERAARITGYASVVGLFGHSVAETNDDLMALIAAAPSFTGSGILVPVRNGSLMRWCLAHGLNIVQQMTLMTIGLYNEPQGAYLPSIIY